MPSAVVFKVIKPTRFKNEWFVDAVEEESKRIGNEMLKDFRKTVRTWNDKPRFRKAISVGPRSVDILVGTDNDIYRYVNDGTRVRYAVMSRDFIPKTRVRHIGSFRGRGGMVFINKNHPMPGIVGRHFDEEIQKKWQSRYKKAMERVMSSFRSRSGHAI